MVMRKCQNISCNNELPHDCRKEMKYCSVNCRVAVHRRSRRKDTDIVVGVVAPMTQEERDEIYRRIKDEIEQAKDF